MTIQSNLFRHPPNTLRSRLTRCAILASCLSLPPAADATAQSGGVTSGAWHASLGASDLASTLDGSVRRLMSDGGARCYIAGNFTQPEHCVSYWNGASYESLGTGAWIGESSANDLSWYQGSLYAAGRFMMDSEDGSGPIRSLLIRLDESSQPPIWRSVIQAASSQSNDEAWALKEFDGSLWIGGDFTMQDGTRSLGSWNGIEANQESELGADGAVYSLETHGERLYAGGQFSNVGSECPPVHPDCPLSEENLASRDAMSMWTEQSSGADGPVYALHSVSSGSNQGLYVGGAFDRVDGNFGFNGLARYDSSTGPSMQYMDGGVNGSVYAIQKWAGGIAVGGLYQSAGNAGMAAFNIANWDETDEWNSMDSGVFGSVVDAPYGASVLALSSHGNGQSDGVYAGGNFMAHGADERSNLFAAKFSRFLLVGPSEDFMSNLTNASLEALQGPYWRFSQIDDAEPASCSWGIENASFQRIAWDPHSLVIGEQLGFMPSEEGTVDLSIFKQQGPGPFLPPIEVVEFSPRPGNEGAAYSITCLTADGEYIELPPFQIEGGFQVECAASPSSLTISNGFFWDKNESFVIEFESAGRITVGGESIENVVSFGLVSVSDLLTLTDNGTFSVNGSVTLDFDRCGFGYQGNLHRFSGADSDVEVSAQGDWLSFEGQEGSVIEVVDPRTAIGSNSYPNAEMSFKIQDSASSWELSIELLGGVIVGTPGDTFTLEDIGQGSVDGRFEPQGMEHGSTSSYVRLGGAEGEVRNFEGPLEFQMIGMGPDTEFSVESSTQDATSILRWTGPGLVILNQFPDIPVIEGPSGLIIGKTEGADGDDTWDVLQRRSLTVTTKRPMRMQILEERFEIIDGGPHSDPADINGDGTVNGQDLAELLARWGSADPAADINGDGSVDGQDLASLLAGWE